MFSNQSTACVNNLFNNKAMHATTARLFDALRELVGIDGYAESGRVAQRLGESAATITNWKSRGVSKQGMLKANRLFGIDPRWLATGEGDMKPAGGLVEASNVAPAEPRARVPIINWVQAGNWADIEPHFDLTENHNWHDIYNGRPSRHAFALVVDGDSMTSPYPGDRSFPAGTIIVVDPERGASAGDYVVAKDVSTQQATFKRLAHDAGRWYLKPLNPSYPIMEIDDPAIRVIGRVVEFSISGVL